MTVVPGEILYASVEHVANETGYYQVSVGQLISLDIPQRIRNPENGHWYKRFDDTMTWHDAKAHCESLSGYLATLTSQSEHAFVYDNLGVDAPY